MKTLTKQRIKEIIKNPTYQHWIIVSRDYELSESFIREFKDNVWWVYISIHQTLSESFIREFKDKVHWISVSRFQTLSENFIYEFFDKIYIYYIVDYQKHLSTKAKNKIKIIHELNK